MNTLISRCLFSGAYRAGRASPRATLRCLGLTASVAIALSGCEQRPPPTGDNHQLDTLRGNTLADGRISVYRDRETGCEYLIFNGYRKGGITPRLKRGEGLDPPRPICAASGMEARQGGNEVPSRSDDSPTANEESGDAQ